MSCLHGVGNSASIVIVVEQNADHAQDEQLSTKIF